jgi:predicted Zn finger-like uncharacterized protein
MQLLPTNFAKSPAQKGHAMKIQCQSCQAKYTIADEKVLGKVVKIRCKKCSATIVINGNETRPAEDNQDTNVFDYAGQSNEQWTVNVADGDQRTMTPQEIVSEYKNGVVNDETYCWKDGMADWLPLREIEQLYGAVKIGAPAAGGMRAPQASFDEISVPPQSVRDPGPAAQLFSAPAAEAQTGESPFAAAAHSNGNGSGANLFGDAHAPPAAARRGGGRGQGADLFGNAAHAGGEDDVMTSAAGAGGAAAAAAGAGTEKLTGQRNENSVLFSLNALTSSATEEKAPSKGQTTAQGDGSGLIDIRALSANMGNDDAKKDKGARVDDIMNLSGGGAFGAALAAPILAPPPLEAADPGMYGGGEAKSNKGLLIAILGGAFVIAIGIVVAVVLVTRQPATTAGNNPTATASGAAGMGSVAMNDTSTPTGAVTAPGTTGGSTDNTPPPPGTGQAAGGQAGPKHTGAVVAANNPPAGGGGAKQPDQPKVPDPPKQPDQPKDLAGALAAAAGQPAAKPPENSGGGSTAPFDRGAAAAALGGINVQGCKKPDGPTGSGHVKVTFAPNGSVSAAVVDSGPFPGTPVGGCVAGRFRGAHIPAFSGAAVTVGKSFNIN